MRITILILILSLSTLNLKAQETEMNKETISYSLGLIIAKNLKSQGFTDIDMSEFSKGFGDLLNENELKISLAEANLIMQNYSAQQQQSQFGEIKKEGEDFLAANAEKEGVVTTASGLQYKVIVQGDGPKPGPTDKVKTHYHGTLINGKVFDSSVERGEPISFPVNGVIKGWQEALQLMSVGSKYQLYIPFQLAYGAQGAGADIKPYSALIFDVELIEINPTN